VDIVIVTVAEPPEERVMLFALNETVGPLLTRGETDVPPTLNEE
jgi:hypothetical protein